MLPDGGIAAEHVWKRFRADRRRNLLRDEMERLLDRAKGRSRARWRWALRDVGLRADPGESIGLIGANGAGKSTLLKLLTRVMYPYAGRVDVAGRVGALIEVRAGLHPELMGSENIYLYGSLLGLARRDVARRFDEIVAFAELDDAINRQVKFYSSGMQMRLGFAIAAFLEPDVLLVDEVLAVGDASFQQKCLDRMRAILAQGTTLVLVSHDLAAVESTCSRGVWLTEGVVASDGPVREVVGAYRRWVEEGAESISGPSGLVRLLKAELTTGGDEGPVTQGPLEIRLVIESPDSFAADVHVGVSEGPATPIFTVRRPVQLRPGEAEIRCALSRIPLGAGRFYLWVGLFDGKHRDLLSWHPAAQFDVTGPALDPPPRAVARLAPVHVDASWSVRTR